MKKVLFILLVSLMGLPAFGSTSAISVSADQKEHTILVYVNGKLVNSSLKKYVRHKSTPGFHVVKVKIYDNKGKFLSVVNQRIYIKGGFENNYHIQLTNNKKSLKKMPLYPLYSNFFYNPALYTRNTIIA